MSSSQKPGKLVYLFLVFFLASTGAYAKEPQAIDVAKSFIDALSNRDADSAIELLHPDAILEMPYPLAAGENKYGTRRMWGEPLRMYVGGIIERNSKIAFNNMTWHETTSGTAILEADGNLIRAKDGQPYQNRYVILFEAKGGKLITWREYFNPVTAARTFGIPLESLPN